MIKMIRDNLIFLGKGDNDVVMYPKLANRHGLVAGATGTGKTITLKVLAESFSELGVPVFLADIKGDVSGMCEPGVGNEKLAARLAKMGIDNFDYKASPVDFWDVFGKQGHPVQTRISDMGPVLLSRILGLTEVQEGVLNIVFRIADDRELLLIDLKDLRAMLTYVGEHSKEFTTDYGNVSKQSVGAIQRALLALEDAGGENFFREPALEIADWQRVDANGHGIINILDCVELYQKPVLYATFMLWLLNELFETLPEVGDLDKPKMVFFFDEAHLLFKDTPKVMADKIEQVVKLIRSKGVGVYFLTQNPADIPDGVLGQLGNRIQHALRAYTPADQKAIRAATQTFRVNPKFDTKEAITDLGIGEALVSVLDMDGKPTIVERAKIVAPHCSMKGASDDSRQRIINASLLAGKYDNFIDRESAYEELNKEFQKEKEAEEAEEAAKQAEKEAKAKAKAEAAAARAAKHQPKSVVEEIMDKTLQSLERKAISTFTRSLFGLLKR